jgi:Mg-chelatase subunit ChlD
MNTQYQVVPGSLSALAQQTGKSLAESFLSCEIVILVDTSGSMDSRDSRGNRSRYEVACEELSQLQRAMPGAIGIVAFSDRVEFCPAGIPTYFGGGTDLAGGLRFIKIADLPGMRFVVISDGEPQDEAEALRVARTFKSRIDVIFCGPEDRPAGRDFLQRLAAASGGQSITADRAKELSAGIQYLLKG